MHGRRGLGTQVYTEWLMSLGHATHWLLRRDLLSVVIPAMVLAACGSSAVSIPTSPTPIPTPAPTLSSPAPSPLPPAPPVATVERISLQVQTVPSGQQVQGTVTVTSAAPPGTQVFLSSSDPSASVPVAIPIPEGTTSGIFTVTTQQVIFDTPVTIRATSGASERSVSLRLIAPPLVGSSSTYLRFISSPGDGVGQGRSLQFDASASVTFRGIVWTWERGSSSEHQLVLSIAELTPRYRDWTLTLSAPRGQRLVPGLYRDATRIPDINTGNAALAFSGDGRACNQSLGEFEIVEARYAPRPPNGERIERLVVRFRQVCDGAAVGMTGEASLNNIPTP